MLACSFVAAIAAVTACANAGGQGNGDDTPPIDGAKPIDASDTTPDPDAPAIDAAAPTPITLTQNGSTAIGSNSSIACGNPDGTTAENSWYRIFRLAEAGIAGGFRVTAVSFGVQETLGQPQVQIKIGTYSGTIVPPPSQLDAGLISPLTATTFDVPNVVSTAPMMVTVPIIANVPALSQMIVEVFSPNQQGQSKYFYIGGNAAGETKPGYLRAPSGACATPQPRSTAVLGFPDSQIVISVSGTH